MSIQDEFCCRDCNVILKQCQGYCICPVCAKQYPVIEGIPVFIRGLTAEQKENKCCTDELFPGEAVRQGDSLNPTTLYDRMPERYLALFGEDPQIKRVLDLGCGDGMVTLSIVRHKNFIREVCGLDISLKALSNFRRNYLKQKVDKKITLLCSTAEKMFLPDNCFDAVVCNKFIHHLPLAPLLEEVRRVLKPGGYFISLREPHRNQFTTYFRMGYYTCINMASFIIQRIIKNRRYAGGLVHQIDTKKYIYSSGVVRKSLGKYGFGRCNFYLSKFIFPFTKMFLYPLSLKFPGARPYFESVIKLAYDLDVRILEKIVFKGLLQEISFCARKL